jgi:hypothetical protein
LKQACPAGNFRWVLSEGSKKVGEPASGHRGALLGALRALQPAFLTLSKPLAFGERKYFLFLHARPIEGFS